MQIRISLCLLLLIRAAPLAAQTVTGTIEGRVTDPSGAVIAAAGISARNAETGLSRTTRTNQEGYYRLTFLPVGSYTLSAVATGFGNKERTVAVELNSTRNVEFELQPSAVATQLTVAAETPEIETTRGEIKSTVTEQEIEDRPLSSRNILSLMEMLPGFQTGGGYSGVNNPTLSSGSYVNFNGTGSRSATFQIDGVNNDDSSEGISRQNVNISAIKEFQVLTNAYPAEFGRAGGAVVLVQTRTGTNRIHGDAYEFLQNEKLNANTFFGNSFGTKPDGALVSPRAPYRRNQFGYTVGGPILKNKLFFFHSFEQTRLIQYNTPTRWIFLPSEKLQVGDCRLCLNPAQHPHLQQDMARLQSIMDRFPTVTPNNPVACDHCYTETKQASYPDQDYSGRLDYNARQGDNMAVRYQYSRQRRRPLSVIEGESAFQNNKQANVMFTETHMFTPTTIGEFRLGIGLRTTLVDISSGNDTPIVRISNPVGFGTTMGSAGQFPIHRYQTDYQFVYNLSHVRGRHTLRAGIDYRRQHLDDLADNYSRGWWTFGASGVLGQPSRYEGWENFLRGYVTDYQKGYGNFTTYNRLGESNQYVMDDVKLLPNVTLNLGFRWEVVFKPSEVNNKARYDYNTFYGYEPRFGIAWTPKTDAGFWNAVTGGTGNMAVRAGFGLFHNRIFQSIFSQGGISLRSLPPYGAFIDFSSATFETADPTNGFVFDPNHYNPGRITSVRVDPGLGMPSIQQYHLTVDRTLPGKIVLSAGYNRTRGIGLLQNQITNRARFPFLSPQDGVLYDQIDPDLGNTAPKPGFISIAQPRTNQRRPDTRYTSMYVISNGSWSYYNALRLSVRKRYGRGLQWSLAYSFGKTIDTGSDVTQGTTLTENGAAASNRGLSDFQQKHRVNVNFSYLLPWNAKARGLRGALLGGWTVSSNDTFASGNPFTVTAGYDFNADGVSNDRPILLDQSIFARSVDNARPDPKTGRQISTVQLPIAAFYPNVFVPQSARPFDPGGTGKGSLGRNTFFGQGLMNIDVGMYKSFRIREGHKLAFRAELYGATNTPHFAHPNASVMSQSFGRITSTYNPFNYVGASRSDASARVIQLALRYTF